MIGRRDLRLLLLWAGALALFFWPLLAGWTYYWGDLSYLHFPWKTFAAQAAQAGRFPHWDPYTYLGMPFHAALQAGVLYPGSVLFYVFPFETALALYLPLHFFLGGAFAFLFLRSIGARRGGALLAATAFALGGVWVSHLPFLNHLAALCWLPALLLLPRPGLFALAFALSLLAGYPTMSAGSALAAVALRLAWEPTAWAASAAGLAWGLALAAPLLAPGLPLAASSVRGAGMPADVITQYSFAFSDWPQLTSVLLLPKGAFNAATHWWSSAYWGLVPFAAALLGAWKLRRRPWLLVYAAAVLFLCLGSSFSPSAWAWTHLPGLSLVRYPGNMLYLLLPALLLFTAAAALPGWVWLLAAAELVCVGSGAQPVVRRPYFAEPGPLVRRLQGELGAQRYLLTPRALGWSRGRGDSAESAARDFKARLYGLTNLPYRLSAVGNFGEPLVPKGAYDWMDYIFRRPSLGEAGLWREALGLGAILSPEPVADPVFKTEGVELWAVQKGPPASRAYLYARPLPEGGPSAAPAPPSGGRPLGFEAPREDAYSVSGQGPGWAYVSNPGAGWRAWSGGRAVELRPALGAFVQARVPEGPFRLEFRYRSPFWGWGLALGLAALAALSALALTGAGRSVIVEKTP